jgi:hypothetical protein
MDDDDRGERSATRAGSSSVAARRASRLAMTSDSSAGVSVEAIQGREISASEQSRGILITGRSGRWETWVYVTGRAEDQEEEIAIHGDG